MRLFLPIAIAASVLAIPTGIAEAVEITKPKAVLELFTSQGCSSCPPADKLVAEFSKNNEILAISTHVDYWDYLGWKDSFASRGNTERQYGYARSLQETQVYTPQAVINGQVHVVGSQAAKIHNTIDTLQKSSKGLSVPIEASVDGNSLNISVENNPAAQDATLFLLSLSGTEKIEIGRGENAGRTIEYHNVLKAMQPIGMMKPSGMQISFPLRELQKDDADCYALLLQKTDRGGNPAAIIGALYIDKL